MILERIWIPRGGFRSLELVESKSAGLTWPNAAAGRGFVFCVLTDGTGGGFMKSVKFDKPHWSLDGPYRFLLPWRPSPMLAAAAHQSIRVLALAIAMLVPTLGCTSSPKEPIGTARSSPTESWQCRNDLEVRCGKDGCEATAGDGFTPMSVSVDDSGAMSVCAYSGCWEGVGEVVKSEDFLVLIGHRLEFSTAQDKESGKADILVAIDRADGVATLKALDFAHPLLCQRSSVQAK